MTTFLLATRALALLAIAAAAAATTSSTVAAQPLDNITFGQSCVLSGPNAFLGTRMTAGVRAAFKEFNDAGGARGRVVSLVTYDDGYNPAPAAANTQQLLSADKVFALIGYVGTPTAVASIPIATAAGCPFIGAFTGTSALRAPYDPNTVNVRASYNDETAAMTQLLVGKYSLRRIACFYQNDSYGFAGLAGITRALKAINLPLISTGLYTRNTVDVSAGLAAIAAPGNIQAVVIIATYSATAQFIREAKQRSGIAANCRFIAVSFVGSEALASALSPSEYANVFVTQVVPPPTDRSSLVVQKYQAAMGALEGPGSVPDFVSFEGYLAGRLATSVLARMTDATRASFIATVQKESLFVVDDLVLGLYTGPCGASTPAAGVTGCDCNQGSRRVWTTALSAAGQWVPEENDFVWSLATCQSPTSLIVAPMSFVVSYPAASVVGGLVADGIAAAFAASVTRSIASGRALVAQRRPYAVAAAAGSANVSSQLNRQLTDVFASGVVGSALAAAAAAAVDLPVIGRVDVSMSDAIRDALATVTRAAGAATATATAAAKAAQSVFLLTPPLEDEVLALCQAAAARWGAEAIRTRLVVAAAAADLPGAAALASAAAAATVLGGAVASSTALPLAAAPTLASSSVLLLLSDDAADVAMAVRMVQAQQLSGLLLPWSPASLLSWVLAAETANGSDAVLVSRPYKDLSLASVSANATFVESTFVADTAGVATNVTHNPSFQAGYLMGRYIAALVSRSGGALQTADAFLDNIFSGAVSIDDYTVGPFASSSGACTRGLPRVPVQALSGRLVSVMTKASCYADYTAIRTVDNSLAGWIVAVIVVGIAAVLFGAAAAVGRRVRTVYRLAVRPLDAAEPFAVMFVGVKNDAELRDLGDNNYHSAMQTVRNMVRDATRDNRCYEARRVDEGTVMIVAKSVEAALGCAAQLTVAMEATDWTQIITHQVDPVAIHGRSAHDSASESNQGSVGHSNSNSSFNSKSQVRRATLMSRTMSVALSESESVTSHRNGGVVSPHINVGVHYGFGSIDYDADAEAVSYLGAVVTQAALIADAASARQVLVSANLVAAIEESGVTVPGKMIACDRAALDELEASHKNDLRRANSVIDRNAARTASIYIPAGLPAAYEQAMCSEKKKEAFGEAAAAGAGGITAALTSADAGLAKRRVAVVSLDVPQLLTRVTDPYGARELASDLDELRAVTALLKGTVVSVVGRHIAIGVNLSGPSVTLPQVRATSIALKSLEIFGEGASAGVAGGVAIGAAGVCVGAPVAAADTARLAAVAAGLQCGAAVTSAHELDTQFRVVTIDAVEIPGTDAMTRVLAVLEGIEDDQMEWLYAMDSSKEIATNEQLWAELASRPDGIATDVSGFAETEQRTDAALALPSISESADGEQAESMLRKAQAMAASRAALDELRRESTARGADGVVRRYARQRFDIISAPRHEPWRQPSPQPSAGAPPDALTLQTARRQSVASPRR